jgi:hypothetical protein
MSTDSKKPDNNPLKSWSATNWTTINEKRATITIDGKSIGLGGDIVITQYNLHIFGDAVKNLPNDVIIDVRFIEMMTTYILYYDGSRWVISHYGTHDVGDNIATTILKIDKVDEKFKQTKIFLTNNDFMNVFIKKNNHIFDNKQYQDHVFTIRVNHPALNYTQHSKNSKTFNSAIYVLAGVHDGKSFISRANPLFQKYEGMFNILKKVKDFTPERKFSISDFKDPQKLFKEISNETNHYGYSFSFFRVGGLFGDNNFIIKTQVGKYLHTGFMSKFANLHIDLVRSQIDNVIFTSIYNSIKNPQWFKRFIDGFCPYYADVFKYVTEFIGRVNKYIFQYNVKKNKNIIPNINQRPKLVTFCEYVNSVFPFNIAPKTESEYIEAYAIKLFEIQPSETYLTLYNILSPTIANMLPRGL